MKKKRQKLCLLIVTALICSFVLCGCNFTGIDFDINDGYDTEEYIPPNYEFTVTASLDKLDLVISNVGQLGDTATLVALPIYQYLRGEEAGLADSDADLVSLSSYECGTRQTYTFDRYGGENNEIDGIYYKFYVLNSDNEILAGPRYCSEMEPIFTHEDQLPEPENIKGIMCEDQYDPSVKDLGCSYTEINFIIDYMITPNEIFDEETKQLTQIEYTEGRNEKGELTISDGKETWAAEYIDYNGKRYYFRLDVGGTVSLRHYDEIIKKYTDDGVRITLILLANNVPNKYLQPYYLCYPATAGSDTYVQLNTSNPYGAAYWGAFMEFLAKRYSSVNSPCGSVQTYVIGNEIDQAKTWNSIVSPNQPPLTLEKYITEYERQLHIAVLATKKYHDNNLMLISMTNHWSDGFFQYSPKEIVDFITLKTLSEGNYDYGFAYHPYGTDLGTPNFWSNDLSRVGINGSLNTRWITWTNLEVFQLYLEQTTKLYNGRVRSVYLTEGGVSSTDSYDGQMVSLTLNQQAAGVAYMYYKCTQLSCIKSVIYYRLVDNADEKAFFRPRTPDGVKKPSYNVYKYIDTQYGEEVAAPYLKYITWTVTMPDGRIIPYGQDVGNVNSYYDTMKLVNSKFDWSCHWDESLIVRRTVDNADF